MAEASLNRAAPSTAVEWNEVQRLVLSGFPALTYARFLLLRVVRPADAARHVGTLLDDGSVKFGWGPKKDLEPAFCVAFTRDGLAALGLSAETVEGFSPEFVDGMTSLGRPRKFGDTGESAPETWQWGCGDRAPHLLVAIYAATDAELSHRVAIERSRLDAAGLAEICGENGEELGITRPLDDRREHFGFADGLSQPRFRDEPAGIRTRSVRDADRIASGELLLGYENEASIFPRSPRLSSADASRPGYPRADRDFGRNGSYLVYRTLEQDVGGFWKAMGTKARSPAVADRVELAAKIVGRWPDGSPLVTRPDPSAPASRHPEDFDYAHDDASGTKCPFGAHIRRTNPRATLARDPDIGLSKSKKHRILRRGRPYGEPFVPGMTPEDLTRAADAGTCSHGARGLHFLCFNADIANQFEFVQQTWTNGPVFQGLHGEVDPLVGDPGPTNGRFTIPGEVLRTRVEGLPRFVRVRGGAYFFAPSRAALLFLASR